MKFKTFSWLLPLIVLGCSRHESTNQGPSVSPAASLPGISIVETPESIEEREIGSRALALLTNADYDGLEKLMASYRVVNAQFASGFAKLAVAYNAMEPTGAPEADWQSRQRQIQDWIRAEPKSPTARIAMARILTGYAWNARGVGWAGDVKEENWKIFFARLQQASEYLKQTKELHEKCPAYWSSLQTIALGLQVDRSQYDKICAQAIQEFPDYQYYYTARASYLLPRWNGKGDEWVTDLAKSADRVGGKAGDMLYARVTWQINQYSGITNIFTENESLSWERIDRGFEVILKQFPGSLAAENERVHLAALAGEKEKARNYFIQTEGQVDLSQWDNREEVDRFVKWLASP